MARTIALSNLSILGTSLLGGPEAAWNMAWEAGFDALKVNPLRGWNVRHLALAGVPVTAFEAPWRNSFKGTLRWAWRTGEWRALLIDPLFFGYRPALERVADCCFYFSSLPTPGVICVDGHRVMGVMRKRGQSEGGLRWAIETDANKLWIDSVCPEPWCKHKTFVVLDTWHMRDWARTPRSSFSDKDELATLRYIIEYPVTEIVAIDVQTRNPAEWLTFLQGEGSLLGEQLTLLSELPETVSAALEIHPAHLKKLSKWLKVPPDVCLEILQKRIRATLG
jgi:hypothetical protein